MSETPGPTEEEIAAALKLSDDFAQAHPADDMLGDIPENALPPEYRTAIKLRMDKNSFYVAFSDDPNNLVPQEELKGHLPNAALKRISVMSSPGSTGRLIKGWIDGIRAVQPPPPPK